MKKLISLFILSAILLSCGTSNNVVNNGLFQKRKYNAGWFFKKKNGIKKKSANEENLAFEEQRSSVEPSKKEIVYTNNSRTSTPTVKIKKNGKSNDLSAIRTNEKKKDKKKGSRTSVKKQNLKTTEASEKQNLALNTFEVQTNESNKTISKVNHSNSSSSGLELILLVLLAIILPPLAVYLFQEGSSIFIIDLILFLIGWSSLWFFNLGGLAALAAVVIALLVVFGII